MDTRTLLTSFRVTVLFATLALFGCVSTSGHAQDDVHTRFPKGSTRTQIIINQGQPADTLQVDPSFWVNDNRGNLTGLQLFTWEQVHYRPGATRRLRLLTRRFDVYDAGELSTWWPAMEYRTPVFHAVFYDADDHIIEAIVVMPDD